MASVRYRVLIPMRELVARGHDVILLSVDSEAQLRHLDFLSDADTIVLWKVPEVPGLFERAIEKARAKGATVVYDLCDDHFDHAPFGEILVNTCRSADVVVASTQLLAETIQSRTGRIACVIPEPYEGPKGKAKWSPASDRIKLLWFGHWTNLDTIEDVIPNFVEYGAKCPLSLTVVTTSTIDLLTKFKQFNQRHRHRLSLRFVKWTSGDTWRELDAADIVVIPQKVNERTRNAKSANRLIESVWAGRFVIANPVPSYLEFGEWVALHENICDGLDWSLANQGLIASRIDGAQVHIEENFSPSMIAGRWECVLLDAAATTPAR